MSLALDVARAALMEVRADPALVFDISEASGRRTLGLQADDAIRAVWLGLCAEHGPNFLIRCESCRPKRRQPCTPVRDVLRGVRCGR